MRLKKKEGPEKENKAVRRSKKPNYTSQEHSEGMMASKD